MKPITEDKIEQLTIEQLNSLGWEYIHGSVISPEGEKPERESYEQIILTDRLRKAVSTLIPTFQKKHRNRQYKKYSASIHRIFSTTTKHFTKN